MAMLDAQGFTIDALQELTQRWKRLLGHLAQRFGVNQRVIEPIIMGLDLSAVGARINHVEIGGQERVHVAISDQGDTDRDMFLVDASYRLAPDTIRPGAPDTFFSMTVDKATSFDIAAKTARVEFTDVLLSFTSNDTDDAWVDISFRGDPRVRDMELASSGVLSSMVAMALKWVLPAMEKRLFQDGYVARDHRLSFQTFMPAVIANLKTYIEESKQAEVLVAQDERAAAQLEGLNESQRQNRVELIMSELKKGGVAAKKVLKGFIPQLNLGPRAANFPVIKFQPIRKHPPSDPNQ